MPEERLPPRFSASLLQSARPRFGLEAVEAQERRSKWSLYLIEPIGQRLVKTSSQGLTQNYRSVLRP
jgi:hypothetical protein